MTPDRWTKIDELFHAALEREPGERAAFLEAACEGDETLRAEVESLLASHEQSESFIETPAADVAAGLLAEGQAGLVAGQTVGHYKIVNLLAAGGMGEVYLADDTKLRRKVALKLLPPQFTAAADRVRRFEQEARAASALNHPNIVTIYEIGQTDSAHFIATEFVDGKTLRDHLATARMPVDEALDVAAQVASALRAAHEAGIVHRDVKPENVMLRRDRIVKVLDFGLAKLAPRQLAAADSHVSARTAIKTNPGVVMGTVAYMSPEQARGRDVDHRTDIWSLGVVLYEMLTGRAPFEGETPSHITVSILENDPPPLAHYAVVPAEAERIVTKALRKDRRERYQTASDMALDLKSLRQELEVEARLKRSSRPGAGGEEAAAKSGEPLAAGGFASRTVHAAPARPTSSAEYLVGQIKRHRLVAALAAAVVVVALTTVAYFKFFAGKDRLAEAGEAIDSVAVLPFVNETGDPNTEYLSDSISDHLINSLSRLPNLRVISLNSVMRYKGKQIDPQAVGRDLNVRSVLIGRLGQRGDDLTISTELVDVRDSRRLWGEQYSRKMSDILVVQDEIARKIAERLRLRLTGEEQKQLAKRQTENTEAYHLYSLGTYYFRKGKAGWPKSIEYFEQAIKADPNYALPYFGLFRSHYAFGTDGQAPPQENRQKIEWAALKAVELDDSLAPAHAALGFVKKMNWDWAGAEKEYKRALELDPNGFDGYGGYAVLLLNIGRTDEALPLAERAEELDELIPPRKHVAFAYLYKRDFDKVIELHTKAKERNPGRGILHLGEAYLGKGMYQEAVAEFEKVVNPDEPESWRGYPILAYAYAAAGQRDKALKILREQQELAKQRYISPFNFAIIYTGLGDKDRAFEYLEKSIEERTLVLYHFPHRPLFDPLRSDPRYEKLLRKMNFPL